MGITIKEIADLCGVSTGTVDRALNNRTGISDKTKARILSIAEKMNYKPDYMAQSLARGRTMTIGVVLFDLYNRLFAQLLNAIELEARQRGYFVDVVLTDKQPETELSCLQHLVNRKVDGSIVYFAAIMGMDSEIVEASEIDGANAFQRILYITLPWLKPTFIILMLFSLGGVLRGNFGLFYNLVGGE